MQEKAVLEISKSETQPKAREVAPPSADSRAFAEEVIQKIEAQIKEEEALQSKDELGTIANSVGLEEESQAIAEKLNVKSEFNSLNEEVKTLQTETVQKIKEVENGGFEENKIKTDKKVSEKLELSEFSKRYSAFYRKQIALKINKLRSQYQTKMSEKPAEIESLNLSIQKDATLMEDVKNKKISDEELQKKLIEQKNEIDLEIKELKTTLDKRKNSFTYKIQEMFIRSKNSISEENFEILQSAGVTKDTFRHKLYQKDFEAYQTIEAKKSQLGNAEMSLQEKEKEIKAKEDLLEKLKISVEDKYKQINEAEEIVNSDSEIKEIEKTMADFYSEMKVQKNQLESETKERSIAEISKEQNVLFCHSIPLNMVKDIAFAQNNKLVDTTKFGPEEKIKMILGVEPTISVSTINKENQKLVNNFGVILKEGQVLSSYAGDAGTLLDGGIYNRKSKYDNNLQTSIVQKNIGDRIGNVVNHIKTSSVEEMEQGWNELIVENPKVAGLFYQKNEYGDAWIPPEAKKLSESLGLPLYVLDKDKIFLYDKETNAVSEVSRENMFDSSKDFSKEEKKNLIEGMIDKEAFNVKRENIYNFNAYNSGKGYFKFMKRIDSGERVEISYLNEDTVVEDGDDVIQLFSRNYIIKKNSIPEESWKGWIKENYEKHGLYYRQKQDYEKKSEDDKGYFFNPKFNEEGYAASGEFIMEGDNTASYINMLEKNFEELSSRQNEIKKEHGGSDIPLNKKALIFNLFGFAEECKKANDLKNYEKATKLVEKFGRVDECETFVEKRVGQDGKFQYLTDDAPVEVRKKLKELSVV